MPLTRAELQRELSEINQKVLALMKALEERPAPPPPPLPPPPSWTPGEGLLRNPYIGRVDNVTEKPVSRKTGGFGIVYEIHTKAAKFETWDAKQAKIARDVIQSDKHINIQWGERQVGRNTYYDVRSIGIQAVAHV